MKYRFNFETLESGAKAMFVNLPHFRTSSIRIMVRSGAFHEEVNTPGSAHFLEHMTIAGTKDLPAMLIQEKYASDNDIYQNAFTFPDYTKYVSNGHDLDSIAFLLTQSVFKPLLSEEEFLKQKQPIISEISSDLADPYFKANIKHWSNIFGDDAVCNVAGDIRDINNLTHKDLLNFYESNYRLDNCWIVVCSGEDIETQRKKINELLIDVKNNLIDKKRSKKTKKIEFNPKGNKSSLIKIDAPEDSTTNICLFYPLNSPKNVRARVCNQILVSSLSALIQSILRTENDLVYGAHCSSDLNCDISFNNNKKQYYLRLSTDVIEENVIKVLDVIKSKIINSNIPDHWIESTIRSKKLDPDYWLQDNPYNTIENIVTCLVINGTDYIDFFEEKNMADKISVVDINNLKKSVFSESPVLTASSPSQKVLDNINDWLNKNPI
jgi:predicted Zn-dependent peptidase